MKKLTIIKLNSTLLLIVLMLCTLAFAPKQVNAQTPATPDIIMYSVNPYLFGNAGFSGIQARLGEIQSLGVNVLWILPIHPIGVLNSIGSPYCIRDFTAINPEFGNMTSFRALVDAARSRGMVVIMDWVANHTARDHPWISANPSWYIRDSQGNIVPPPGTNWTDVAQLNFNNAQMRRAMIDAMRFWITNTNISGFRCDAADFVPFDFWQQAISELRAVRNDLIFMAEGARKDHFNAGFQMNFGFRFYDGVKMVYRDGQPTTEFAARHTYEYSGVAANNRVVRYTTNHDESGWDATPPTILGGQNAALSAFMVVTASGGVPLVYSSQEAGATTNVSFLRGSQTTFNWNQNPSVTTAYRNILNFYAQSNAMKRGSVLFAGNNNVVVIERVFGNERAIVLANTRNSQQSVTLPASIRNQTLIERLTNRSTTLTTSILLQPYQYLVFTPTTVVSVTGVTVSPTSTSIALGGTQQLTATVSPANATNRTVTWSSSSTAVATVSATGLVTGVAAGSATITVRTNDGGRTATSAITVTTAPAVTFYRIRNRWQSTAYLFDGGDRVRYGALPSAPGLTYEWILEDMGSGQVEIRNAGTNEYMHIENLQGFVQCTQRTLGWMSSRWITEQLDGHTTLRNAWQTSHYMHVENLQGHAQHGAAQPGWWSAQWVFEIIPKSKQVQVETSALNPVSIYPNPVVNGRATIVLTQLNSPTKIKIFDLNGRELLNTSTTTTM